MKEAETIYELDLGKLDFSLAIADITQSQAHFHKLTTEIYVVLDGSLEIQIQKPDYTVTLKTGDIFRIDPATIHSARSLTDQSAKVLAICFPAWTAEDHYSVQEP